MKKELISVLIASFVIGTVFSCLPAEYNGIYGNTVYASESTSIAKASSNSKSKEKESKSQEKYTGFKKENGELYFYKNGKVLKGYKKIEGKYYYFDKKDGHAVSGWLKINGDIRYFDDYSKEMLTNTSKTIDGLTYTFKDDGTLVLSKDEIILLNTMKKYITSFKDPTSVRIIGTEVLKFTNLKFEYPVNYGTLMNPDYRWKKAVCTGYIVDISASNSYGAKSTDEYIVIVNCSDVSDAFFETADRGIIDSLDSSVSRIYLAYADYKKGKNTEAWSTISIDNSKLNEELSSYVKQLGY